ncbi:MAG: hypothetical protein IKN31_01125 [Bacteroidales bacterium]|nr:hypothetical protein [Bacteroidales bacterium]
MAHLKCPKCGSYNTGTAYLNYAGKALRVAAEVAGTALLAMTGRHAQAHYAADRWKEDERKKTVKGNVCHNCGHEW